MPNGHALEALARGLGFNNWSALNSWLDYQSRLPPRMTAGRTGYRTINVAAMRERLIELGYPEMAECPTDLRERLEAQGMSIRPTIPIDFSDLEDGRDFVSDIQAIAPYDASRDPQTLGRFFSIVTTSEAARGLLVRMALARAKGSDGNLDIASRIGVSDLDDSFNGAASRDPEDQQVQTMRAAVLREVRYATLTESYEDNWIQTSVFRFCAPSIDGDVIDYRFSPHLCEIFRKVRDGLSHWDD